MIYFDLSHFALLRINGNDAFPFLQAQICGDLRQLERLGWFQSAWCLPNGRVIATFILLQQEDSFFLLLPSMLKKKVMKRLGMYVLRSDVKFSDVGDEYLTLGLAGDKAEELINGLNTGEVTQRGCLLLKDKLTLLKMNQSGNRFILLGRMDDCNEVLETITDRYPCGERAQWSLYDIEAGLPWVLETTTEKFLPQMLNLDLSSGLSYQKGCYPGQEIIARTYYRGQVKKRLYLGTTTSDTTPGPGDRIVLESVARAVGDILDAERNGRGRVRFLAVVEIEAAENDALTIEGQTGIRITLDPVKYPRN